MNKTILSITVIVVVLLAIFGYFAYQQSNEGSPAGSGDPQLIIVDGSSTVFPITEAMAEEFQKENSNTQVVVGISGTGGGFKRFCRDEIDISNASRPIKQSEIDLCAENGIEYIELPIAFDGLSVIVNTENDWVDYMTVSELKKIWEPEAEDKITHWNQIREEWPNEEISLYGPGVDSGTFDYFTDAIVGDEGASRGDFVASEDDNVLVQGIASEDNSLGFFGFAYYKENQDKLKLVPIFDGEEGSLSQAILPNPDTINSGTYKPLSRPIFIYVKLSSAENETINDFINFYIDHDNAKDLVSEVGYVPLPESLYEAIGKRFDDKKVGSVFQDAESAGLTLEEIFSLD